MTAQQILGTAIRLMAIWLIPVAFQLFILATTIESDFYLDVPTVWFVIACLPAALAIFLWFFPMMVAHKLLPRLGEKDTNSTPVREAVAVGTVILGMWAIVGSLGQLFSGATFAIIGQGTMISEQYFSHSRARPDFFLAIFQYALGVFFICMPRFFVNRIFPANAVSPSPTL